MDGSLGWLADCCIVSSFILLFSCADYFVDRKREESAVSATYQPPILDFQGPKLYFLFVDPLSQACLIIEYTCIHTWKSVRVGGYL